jgi:hypothetical protein
MLSVINNFTKHSFFFLSSDHRPWRNLQTNALSSSLILYGIGLWGMGYSRGSLRDVVYILAVAPSYMRPNAREGGCEVSANEYRCALHMEPK